MAQDLWFCMRLVLQCVLFYFVNIDSEQRGGEQLQDVEQEES